MLKTITSLFQPGQGFVPNPLGLERGTPVFFNHVPEVRDIEWCVERITQYETRIRDDAYYHIDYHLVAEGFDGPLNGRLRLIPDAVNCDNHTGYRFQFFHRIKQEPYNSKFVKTTLDDPHGRITHQEGGEKSYYWRQESVIGAHRGTIREDGNPPNTLLYWDYSRLISEETENYDDFEYLTIEILEPCSVMEFLHGVEIMPNNIWIDQEESE